MSVKIFAKPAFVIEVEKELKKLEGKRFKSTIRRWDEGLERHVTIKTAPETYCEGIALDVISEARNTLKSVIFEPNGWRTFPDIEAKFTNGHVINFEVKSWVSKTRAWSAASVEKLRNAIENGDALYFNAWYIDFNIAEDGDYYNILEVTVGKIWDFANGTSINGSTPSLCSRGSASPLKFINNVINNEKIFPMKDLHERHALLVHNKNAFFNAGATTVDVISTLYQEILGECLSDEEIARVAKASVSKFTKDFYAIL